ncbi:MAG: hypothetical protein AAF713_03780 [Pseudomonadota bacterium]
MILSAALLAGCGALGSEAVGVSRSQYNAAIQESNNEQLLLNIVRRRYLDSVLFLEPLSVTTSFSLSANASGSLSFIPFLNPLVNSSSATGSLGILEAPSVTYSPLRGQEFARRILGRIPIDALFLLETSGWSAGRIFEVSIRRINRLENIVVPQGGEAVVSDDYVLFERLAVLLNRLEREDHIVLHGSPVPGGDLTLAFRPEARALPEFAEITKLLGLDPSLSEYRLTTRRDQRGGDTISIQTRSFAGVLDFLSYAVEAPEEDLRRGAVRTLRDAAGETFRVNPGEEGLFRVAQAAFPPVDAAFSVRYNGRHFYISETDIEAKATFSMVAQLFELLSASTPSAAPTLTIDVGG